MAKKRTTPIITDFDQIPADALAPEDEQPYEIPGHWKWVRLGAAVQTSRDKTEIFDGSEKYVGLEHLEKGGGLIGFGDASTLKSAKSIFKPGQLLYGKLRPYLDKHVIVDFDGVCSTDILVYEESPLVEMRWFETWVSSDLFIEQANAGTKGINLPRVSDKYLAATPFPLPPIDEQKAVVEKLQSTNQKIDDVLDRLDQFLDQLPQQRASIIQAGVSGMLTEDWRAENGQSREDWVESTLGGTFRWASGGTPARSNKAYFQGHIPWIKSGELPDGLIDGVAEYITEDAISSSSAKVFPKDSVAIAMYGATIGRTGILAFDAATNQAVAVAAKNEEVDSRFLFYFLQSSRERFMSLGKGGAQPNISQTVIKSFPFEYPVGDEQGEIVAVIEAALSGIETAYKITLDVREKVQAAKRAVRNRALRGIV